jgi:hypothetical protein
LVGLKSLGEVAKIQFLVDPHFGWVAPNPNSPSKLHNNKLIEADFTPRHLGKKKKEKSRTCNLECS